MSPVFFNSKSRGLTGPLKKLYALFVKEVNAMTENLLAAVPTFAIPTPEGGLPGDAGQLISMGISWAIIVAVLVTIAYIIWGGFDYIMSGEDPKKTAAARQKITNGVIGLIIVAATWIIFKFLVSFTQLCAIFNVCTKDLAP